MTYDEFIPVAAVSVFSGCVGRNARIPAAAALEAKTLAEALAAVLGITAEPVAEPDAGSEPSATRAPSGLPPKATRPPRKRRK